MPPIPCLTANRHSWHTVSSRYLLDDALLWVTLSLCHFVAGALKGKPALEQGMIWNHHTLENKDPMKTLVCYSEQRLQRGKIPKRRIDYQRFVVPLPHNSSIKSCSQTPTGCTVAQPTQTSLVTRSSSSPNAHSSSSNVNDMDISSCPTDSSAATVVSLPSCSLAAC